MEFKENLKGIMIEKNISQYKLSKDTGIPQSSLSEYMSGKKEPTLSKAQIIAAYLNVSLDRLATGKNTNTVDYLIDLGDGNTILVEKENRPD